jgi:hypothetical protein
MAAGAILPPLFFERRRLESNFAPRMAFSGTPGNATASVAEFTHRIRWPTSISPATRDGSLLKDI